MLFNKDIYVIRNFALGRCWPEKSRFLCDLTLASPGALNLLWKEVAVTLTTGERSLWCGEGVHCVILGCVELFLSPCFRCYFGVGQQRAGALWRWRRVPGGGCSSYSSELRLSSRPRLLPPPSLPLFCFPFPFPLPSPSPTTGSRGGSCGGSC